MKKAMTLAAAALAMTAALTPLTAEASEAEQVTVVHKRTIQEAQECLGDSLTGQSWTGQLPAGQSIQWKSLSDCIKWGTIALDKNCPWKPETPNKPNVPNLPEQNPENPEKPSIPEQKPENPEKPSIPEQKPENPEKPSIPEQKPESPAEKTFAQRVVELVNVERSKEGLAPLTVDKKLGTAADVRGKEIQQSFSHTRPNGSKFSTVFKEAGVTYRSAGENIAWGQKTPEEVVTAWMGSPGHRANIMDKNYSRIGVSHQKNAQGTSYWVQLFAD